MSSRQIEAHVDYKQPKKKMKKEEYDLWIKLFLDLRFDLPQTFSQHNLEQSLNMVEIMPYVISVFAGNSNNEKYHLMQFLLLLNIIIPDSMLLRLKTTKDKSLRKLSHTYSMLANVEEPYSNLSRRDKELYDCLWDNMELHHFFKYRKLNDKPMPPFVSCIETFEGTELEPFFIREIAYWGNKEEELYLKNYFSSDKVKCRTAAFKAIGIGRITEIEEEMKNKYDIQSEDVKRVILKSVLDIRTGKSALFFKEAFLKTASVATEKLALFCLRNYNKEGKMLFEELKTSSPESKKSLFAHVDNYIISSNIIYS